MTKLTTTKVLKKSLQSTKRNIRKLEKKLVALEREELFEANNPKYLRLAEEKRDEQMFLYDLMRFLCGESVVYEEAEGDDIVQPETESGDVVNPDEDKKTITENSPNHFPKTSTVSSQTCSEDCSQLGEYNRDKLRIGQIMRDFMAKRILLISARDGADMAVEEYISNIRQLRQSNVVDKPCLSGFLRGSLNTYRISLNKVKGTYQENKLFIPEYRVMDAANQDL